jgi:hypothetical protein
LGLEKDAQSFAGNNPFTDVPDWGVHYAAYGYDLGITVGVNDEHTLFASNRLVTFQEFTAFLLRVLQYYEKDGDFAYADAIQKAIDVGMFKQYGSEQLQGGTFLRGNAVLEMVDALLTYVKDSNLTLIDKLVTQGVISQQAAKDFIDELVKK